MIVIIETNIIYYRVSENKDIVMIVIVETNII